MKAVDDVHVNAQFLEESLNLLPFDDCLCPPKRRGGRGHTVLVLILLPFDDCLCPPKRRGGRVHTVLVLILLV